jgi:hypothetical protein
MIFKKVFDFTQKQHDDCMKNKTDVIDCERWDDLRIAEINKWHTDENVIAIRFDKPQKHSVTVYYQ